MIVIPNVFQKLAFGAVRKSPRIEDRKRPNIIPNVIQKLAFGAALKSPRIGDRKRPNIKSIWGRLRSSIPGVLACSKRQFLKDSRCHFFSVLLGACLLSSTVHSSEPTQPNEPPKPEFHGATYVDDSKTFNQTQVAIQLDSLVAPTASQSFFLNHLNGLVLPHIRHTLNQLTGQQHAADLFVTDYINRQFIKRLYDPIRPLVTKDLCHQEWYDLEKATRCFPLGIDYWVEASGSRLAQKGDKNAIGFKVDGVEASIGWQKTFFRSLTFGIACSYEYDHIHHNLGGTGNMNTVFAGAYGLYRAPRYYILGDVAYGFSVNKWRRSVGALDLQYSIHSSPKSTQLTGYVEAGVDFSWEDLLIQPFIGVEVAKYRCPRVKEHGGMDWDLTINARKRTLTSTRLGVHLTSDNLPSNLGLSIDLAWNYRCTPCNNVIWERFATFGTEFSVHGVTFSRNFFDGALTVTKEIFWNLTCYGRFSGEMWRNSSAYTVLLGVDKSW